ncbi:2OG-Fe(II) oxygenase [Nocardia grenadensis]|uniref:2OG-Fe(II) oxygenase n=1 Tax=Nocardia grenadensis TaxID=931537 RepID=UPI003D8EBC02
MTDNSTSAAVDAAARTNSVPLRTPFHWLTFDMSSVLPRNWDNELLSLAAQRATQHSFRPTMSSAREPAEIEIALESVNGEMLYERVPWLYDLYLGWFRTLAERYAGEPLYPTSTHNRALSLNILRGGGIRYPCHVDSNPAQGLLYLTDCNERTGGELVVARRRTARDIAEVDADCTVLYPRHGQLLVFDAREHAHYVRPMHHPDGFRAVVTMNYYSESCPEAARPLGLDEQLFGSVSR